MQNVYRKATLACLWSKVYDYCNIIIFLYDNVKTEAYAMSPVYSLMPFVLGACHKRY